MTRRIPGLLLALLLSPSFAHAETPAAGNVVDLVPDERAPAGVRNFFAPFSVLFLGPGYWYGERTIRIETSPPGAELDLFYVRANFQKRYEQATAPVLLRLPTRIEAGPRDAVTIRAFVEGHKIQDVSIPIRSRQAAVTIDLSPLDNRLEGAAHTYMAGRGTLSLLLKQPPQMRVQEREGGVTVVLNQTARSPEAESALESVQSPLIERVSAQQLGEDVLVRIDWTPEARADKPEMRSRTVVDPARGLQVLALDFVRRGDEGASPQSRAISALARIEPRQVTGCAQSFDAALREALDPSALARALAPRGGFSDPILRSAMRRLGELSPGGRVTLVDGSQFTPAVPLELEAALSQASLVKGYLALLHQFSRNMEGEAGAAGTFRGLVAPEMGESEFAAVLSRAAAGERSCGGR